MRWKYVPAALALLGLGGIGCQTRDVPTDGRRQAVEVGTREAYPGTGRTIGGSQQPSDEGMARGVMRGGGAAGGSAVGGDPGQIQSGGANRMPGHPVMGEDTLAKTHGQHHGSSGMGGAGDQGSVEQPGEGGEIPAAQGAQEPHDAERRHLQQKPGGQSKSK